jgi:putative DNA primase/helicase
MTKQEKGASALHRRTDDQVSIETAEQPNDTTESASAQLMDTSGDHSLEVIATNELDDLLQAAKDGSDEERPEALRELAAALALTDPITEESYAERVKQAGLLGKTVFKDAIQEAAKAQQEATSDLEFGESGLPRIDAGDGKLPRVTAKAWAALHAANGRAPFIFRFGGLVTRIELDDEGYPITCRMGVDRMRHTLARVAEWHRGGIPAHPPLAVVRDVLATPDLPLPILTGIVGAPVFAADGTLETEPGYHPNARVYYFPNKDFHLPEVPESPTREDLERAKALIFGDLLVDFPFVDDASRAHTVALMLLLFVREMIQGATPLHLFEKPMPGTGATLLTDLLVYPATGRPILAMTEGTCENEMRKRITAKLRRGPQMVLIDNLRKRLESSALASAITAPVWEDRIITTSLTARIPVRCAWAATGNNPTLSNEMARRTVPIRMDANMDRPWMRQDFKHSNLRQWAKDHRGELVWSVLTIVRFWIANGSPKSEQSLGMFEEWTMIVGGILETAGIPGFLGNLDEFYERSDAEGSEWREFVRRWWNEFRDQTVGVTDLFSRVAANQDTGIYLPQPTDHGKRTTLGVMLARKRDQRFVLEFGDKKVEVKIEYVDNVQRANRWRLTVTREW